VNKLIEFINHIYTNSIKIEEGEKVEKKNLLKYLLCCLGLLNIDKFSNISMKRQTLNFGFVNDAIKLIESNDLSTDGDLNLFKNVKKSSNISCECSFN
jgi:hypothetical protein